MTTENHLNPTARKSTGLMAKNRIGETAKQQHHTVTDRTDEAALRSLDMKPEKQKDQVAEKKKATMNEREIIQAAREKAKEEEEKSDGLWEVRARFKNLAQHVLPKNPYLMGIPSKIHITTHEGPDWRRGTPFSPHEERVQYVSFQRLDDDETVLRPQSWDEENAKSSQSDSTRRTSLDFSSLPGHTPRKKMSMEEYLRKKNSGLANANASQEGSLVQHKAEAKIARDAKVDSTIKSKTSSLESTVSKLEGKATQATAPGPKAQETAGMATAIGDTAADRQSALKSEGIGQKEIFTPKGVTKQKEISRQQETVPQKASVVPKEGLSGKVPTVKKEVVMEKVVKTAKEGMSPSRKRPIEAVIAATDSENSPGRQVAPTAKKARISSTAKILDEPSLAKQANAHGFPPLLSPTLPSNIEEELANLQTRANGLTDSKEDSGDISDGRTTTSGKELRKTDAASQPIPPKALTASGSSSATFKQPGSNGPKPKLADAARDSMFFGQPRRPPQVKKSETISPPKQNAKKNEVIPKAEEDRPKTVRQTDLEGQPRGNAKKPDLTAKLEMSSKANEHPVPKKVSKDVGSDPKGVVLPTSGHNLAPEHREKKTLMVIWKIPRSKRKACQALLRLSPRPRKPNGLQTAPGTDLAEESRREAQTNAVERQSETDKKASKNPAVSVIPSKEERSAAKPNHRGQKRPPGESEDSEPVKKRFKPADDGGKVAGKTLKAAEKDDPEPSSPHRRLPKDTLHDRVEKRSRPAEKDDLEPSKKRLRLSEEVNPGHPALKPSNILQPDSTPKLPTANPKGDVKSAKMRRIVSLDGEVKTPSAAVRGGTPNVPGSAERPSREGRPTSAALSEEAALWRVEQQKYLELGKRLKHELDGIVKKDGVLMKDPMASKKGCPIGVESILCYMLGFTALDELGRVWGKPGNSTAWETLLPHIDYVKAITSSASHIYGLILQLEGICRNTIHSYDLERLEREPNGAAPSPEFLARLVENARSAQKVWLAGTAGLSINDLQSSFPKTWAKRVNAPMPIAGRNGQEKLIAGKFATSAYYLPLSSISTAVEGVKMGWSFLGEWAEKEGVEWKGRMF